MKQATIWCEITCRYCGENIFGEPYKNADTIRRAKRAAKNCGYIDHDEWGTICPECFQRRKQAQKLFPYK